MLQVEPGPPRYRLEHYPPSHYWELVRLIEQRERSHFVGPGMFSMAPQVGSGVAAPDLSSPERPGQRFADGQDPSDKTCSR